jgi:hypothetical protein
LQQGFPVAVALHARIFVVVEPRAAQAPVVHGKAQRLDQVQLAAGVGREADHVTGVGRDFRFDEDDAEHGAHCRARLHAPRFAFSVPVCARAPAR